MRITPNITADNALHNLQAGRTKLERLQEQIASGINYSRPSDDPITTRQLMSLDDRLNQQDQYASNISKSQIWLNMTATALQGMNDTFGLIKKAAATISGGSSSAADRASVVSQLQEFKKSLIDLGNTQYGDQYLFAGLKDDSAPFGTPQFSASLTNGSNTIAGVSAAQFNGLKAGMTVTGTGIPAGTTVTGLDSTTSTITLSNNATLTGNQPISFGYSSTPYTATGLNFTTGSPTVTVSSQDMNQLAVGMVVTDNAGGTQIQSNPPTTITAIDPTTNQVTLSQNPLGNGAGASLNFTRLTNNTYMGSSQVTASGLTYAATDQVVSLAPTDLGKVSVGMVVNGTGVQTSPPTTITKIDQTTNQVTLSAPVTSAGTSLTFGDGTFDTSISNTSKLTLNVTGDKLLTDVGANHINVLDEIDNLIAAINAPPSGNASAIQSATSNIETAATELQSTVSEVAGRQMRLSSAQTMITQNKNTINGIVADVQGVDMIKAATELNQQQTAFQAALSATSKTTQLSLLDYLS